MVTRWAVVRYVLTKLRISPAQAVVDVRAAVAAVVATAAVAVVAAVAVAVAAVAAGKR